MVIKFNIYEKLYRKEVLNFIELLMREEFDNEYLCELRDYSIDEIILDVWDMNSNVVIAHIKAEDDGIIYEDFFFNYSEELADFIGRINEQS